MKLVSLLRPRCWALCADTLSITRLSPSHTPSAHQAAWHRNAGEEGKEVSEFAQALCCAAGRKPGEHGKRERSPSGRGDEGEGISTTRCDDVTVQISA